MSDLSTVEVFGRCMQFLLAKDMEGFLAMLSPDCAMEFPFAPPGKPRVVAGEAALREYFLDYAELVEITGVKELVMHETKDPETIVVEFSGDGLGIAAGKAVEVGFIAVFTARDGLCVKYRDYWNPLTTLQLQP